MSTTTGQFSPDTSRLHPALRITLRRAQQAGLINRQQRRVLLAEHMPELAEHTYDLMELGGAQNLLATADILPSADTAAEPADGPWLDKHPLLKWLWDHRQQILSFALSVLAAVKDVEGGITKATLHDGLAKAAAGWEEPPYVSSQNLNAARSATMSRLVEGVGVLIDSQIQLLTILTEGGGDHVQRLNELFEPLNRFISGSPE